MSLYALAFTRVMPFAALGVARFADVIGMRRELLFAAVAYAICGMLLMPTFTFEARESVNAALPQSDAVSNEAQK